MLVDKVNYLPRVEAARVAVIRDASAHGLNATDLKLLRAMFAVGAESMLNQLMHAMKSAAPLARLHVLREEIELLKVEREDR